MFVNIQDNVLIALMRPSYFAESEGVVELQVLWGSTRMFKIELF